MILTALAMLVAACGTGDPAPSATTGDGTPVTTSDQATTTTSVAPVATTIPVTSTTGATTTVPPSALPGDLVRGWVEGGDLLALVAMPDGSDRIFRSPNGQDWRDDPSAIAPDDEFSRTVTVRHRDRWVQFDGDPAGMCGVQTTVSRSGDGVTWEPVDAGPLAAGGVSVAASNGLVLVVAWFDSDPLLEECIDDATDISVFTSNDGITFTRAPAPPELFGLGHLGGIDDLMWTGEYFILAGSDINQTALWTSPDGVTWTAVGDLDHMASINVELIEFQGLLIVVGDEMASGALALWGSADLVEWNRLPVPDVADSRWMSNLAVWNGLPEWEAGGLVIIDPYEPAFWVTDDPCCLPWQRIG